MKDLCIAAAVIAIIPIFFALMAPEFHLGDQENAVEGTGLKDEKVEEDKPERQKSGVTVDATQQA